MREWAPAQGPFAGCTLVEVTRRVIPRFSLSVTLLRFSVAYVRGQIAIPPFEAALVGGCEDVLLVTRGIAVLIWMGHTAVRPSAGWAEAAGDRAQTINDRKVAAEDRAQAARDRADSGTDELTGVRRREAGLGAQGRDVAAGLRDREAEARDDAAGDLDRTAGDRAASPSASRR